MLRLPAFFVSSFALVLALTSSSLAQELSVLDASSTRWITREVSGDAAYEHVRFMTTTYHRPLAGG